MDKRGHSFKPRVRMLVYLHDNHECVWCGETNTALLTIDHVVPLALQGTKHHRNLITACGSCNNARGLAAANHELLRFGRFRTDVVPSIAYTKWVRAQLRASCKQAFIIYRQQNIKREERIPTGWAI